MSKNLSILICTMQSRADKLSRLMDVLNKQTNSAVEILIKNDNGEMPIGRKRNLLLDEASGEYVAFVDDDDMVSNDYVTKILNAVQSKPDCCSLQGIITFQGKSPRTFIHSLQYKEWFERNNIYYRCPNHLNAVKRSLALAVKFPESNHGEDRDFSTRLLPHLQKEVVIPGVIYHYLYEKGGPPVVRNRQTESPHTPRIRRW